jgi:hypothetical protein
MNGRTGASMRPAAMTPGPVSAQDADVLPRGKMALATQSVPAKRGRALAACVRRALAMLAVAAWLGSMPLPIAAQQASADLKRRFEAEVVRRLVVPAAVQAEYAQRLQLALQQAGRAALTQQVVVLVDRSVHVQALMLFLLDAPGMPGFVGATSVSTGSAGRVDHFLTPLGVFAHVPENPDFRAEGTFNEQGVRGYGEHGLRVFDFGWVDSDRTWGKGGRSPMRLQMHATDPSVLEPRLGRADSKGCIRIPAALNRFIDRYGLIDADYEPVFARGERLWLPLPGRTPVPWPGRYLVVIDSSAKSRPAWAIPEPARPQRSSRAAAVSAAGC